MATTYDWTAGTYDTKPHVTTPRGFSPFVLRNVIDATKQNIAAGDTVQAIDIPAGTLVLSAWINVLTVETLAATASIGTGTDTSKWGSAVALNALGAGEVTGGPAFNPLMFASADTIDVLTAAQACTAGKFEVCALCIDSSSTVDAQ